MLPHLNTPGTPALSLICLLLTGPASAQQTVVPAVPPTPPPTDSTVNEAPPAAAFPQIAMAPPHLPSADNCVATESGSAFQQWKQRQKALWQDRMFGYPEEFHRPPAGMALQSLAEQQRQSGRAARMILCEYDFVTGSAQLKPRGFARLARICEWSSNTPGGVLIESSVSGPEMDEARRETVFNALGHMSCQLPFSSIQTASPRPPALDSDSAALIYENQLQQTRSKGGGTGSTAGSRPATQSLR